MNRGQFLRELVAAGCYLKRHGARHDVYANPKTGKLEIFLGSKRSPAERPPAQLLLF